MVTYETKNTYPGTLPFATIHMNGLLCFSFDHANKCTVAVNNMVGNEHKWKFLIVDPDSGESIVDLRQGNVRTPRELSKFYINVTGGTTQGTYVYTGNPVSIAAKDYRYNLESHWVDMEGPRGHNRPIENDANTLWPRFYINDGLFCTSQLSSGSFDLRDTNAQPLIKPLGKVPVGIVADIFLDNPKSKIEIKLPERTVSLEHRRSKKPFHIYISNDCRSHVAAGQTDFHLHYNAFSGALKKPSDRFHLVAHGKEPLPDSIAVPDGPDPYNDRAPCMGTALGQTSAFKD